jgi:hypothetical protein
MDDIEQFRHMDGGEVWNKRVDSPKQSKKTKSVSAFVRGPIPLEWLIQATSIPRRNALVVGLVLFYLAGLNKDRNGLVLTVRRCQPFGLDRKSVQRGLADLEKAGLVRVIRTSGRSPRVDILSA